ncbi:MAG: tyrosine-type recombinase/integrase [Rhodobacterales bacterium]|nr:tyrosine-type recombinase/integrase [Rhodobacterales bacterium]
MFILHTRNASAKLTTVTLGRYPDISLKTARDLAAHQRLALKSGADINRDKRELRAPAEVEESVPTLGEILTEYENFAGLKRTSWRAKGPKSVRSVARRCVEIVFAGLLSRHVDDVTPEDIASAMQSYVPARKGKSTANGQVSRARSYLGPALDWTSGRGRFSRLGSARLEQIPVVDTRTTFDPAREDPQITGERDRILSEDELRRVLPFLKYPPPPAVCGNLDPEVDFRAIAYRFLLLTAARREELETMRRRDVDLPNGAWNKPSVKSTTGSARKQTLPLSTAAISLLNSLPHFSTSSPDDLVFPNSNGGVLGNWPRIQAKIDLASATTGWHRHDLRRTAASLMMALDVPVSTIDRILGHADPLKRENVSGAAGTYMRLSSVLKGRVNPQATALNTLAEALDHIELQAI